MSGISPKRRLTSPHLLFLSGCAWKRSPVTKQKLRFFSFCHPRSHLQRIPDLPRPLLTPRLSLIRLYPEMYVCDMYKFQTASSPFCVNYLYCTLSRHVSQVYPACTLSQKITAGFLKPEWTMFYDGDVRKYEVPECSRQRHSEKIRFFLTMPRRTSSMICVFQVWTVHGECSKLGKTQIIEDVRRGHG